MAGQAPGSVLLVVQLRTKQARAPARFPKRLLLLDYCYCYYYYYYCYCYYCYYYYYDYDYYYFIERSELMSSGASRYNYRRAPIYRRARQYIDGRATILLYWRACIIIDSHFWVVSDCSTPHALRRQYSRLQFVGAAI